MDFERFWVGHVYGTAVTEYCRLCATHGERKFSNQNLKRVKQLFDLLQRGY